MRFEAKVVGKMRIDPEKYVVLDHARLCNVDYSGRKFQQFCTIGCRMEGCHFQNVRINDAQFGAGRENSEFIQCVFDGARMKRVSGGPSRFVRCSFRNVDIRHWIARAVELVDCVFTGRLRETVFNGRVPEELRGYIGRSINEFDGNDFSNTDFVDVGFRTGVDLTKQKLPSGPEYLYLPDAESSLRRARLELLGWDASECRRVAMTMLSGMERDVLDGQAQLLLRASSYYPYKSLPREAVDALFASLRRARDDE
jgi:uncharacterized protein YjbI with pentapeptide repeats